MLHTFIDFLRSLTDPEKLIALLGTILTGWLGYAALCGILFAETGLLIGFFLPGDSLLFTAGVLSATSTDSALHLSLPWVILAAALGAILGAHVGYLIGRKAGPSLSGPQARPRLREAVLRTQALLARYGNGRAI